MSRRGLKEILMTAIAAPPGPATPTFARGSAASAGSKNNVAGVLFVWLAFGDRPRSRSIWLLYTVIGNGLPRHHARSGWWTQ